MAFDPLKYAWVRCNPHTPFPASLDDGGTDCPASDPEADPKKAAVARERKKLEARKRRGGGRGPDIVLKRRAAPSVPLSPTPAGQSGVQ